jgi:hypothetical protein
MQNEPGRLLVPTLVIAEAGYEPDKERWSADFKVRKR